MFISIGKVIIYLYDKDHKLIDVGYGTGAIIDRNIVLTAAHVVLPYIK